MHYRNSNGLYRNGNTDNTIQSKKKVTEKYTYILSSYYGLGSVSVTLYSLT